jgi:hypothetical protein
LSGGGGSGTSGRAAHPPRWFSATARCEDDLVVPPLALALSLSVARSSCRDPRAGLRALPPPPRSSRQGRCVKSRVSKPRNPRSNGRNGRDSAAANTRVRGGGGSLLCGHHCRRRATGDVVRVDAPAEGGSETLPGRKTGNLFPRSQKAHKFAPPPLCAAPLPVPPRLSAHARERSPRSVHARLSKDPSRKRRKDGKKNPDSNKAFFFPAMSSESSKRAGQRGRRARGDDFG